MEAFGSLRNAARDRRDRAIRLANEEYAATLRRISTLEQDLLGRNPVEYKTIADCVRAVVPEERPFTTVDVMAGLEALDPRRTWRKRSIDNAITQLRGRGVFKRISIARKKEPAKYALVSLDVEEQPFQNMTLAEVVADQLTEPILIHCDKLKVDFLDSSIGWQCSHRSSKNATSSLAPTGSLKQILANISGVKSVISSSNGS